MPTRCKMAKAIAHSPLVKTAWAGNDPNWGRLLSAIGYSGAQVDPERIDIRYGELAICRDGNRAEEFDEAAAHAYVAQQEFSITIQLHQGTGFCVFWTTDLTHEYIQHQRRLLNVKRFLFYRGGRIATCGWFKAADRMGARLPAAFRRPQSQKEHQSRRRSAAAIQQHITELAGPVGQKALV